MAKYEFKVDGPGLIPFTLTMTMRLADWSVLRKALDGLPYHHGVVALRAAIGDMVQRAETEFKYDDSPKNAGDQPR